MLSVRERWQIIDAYEKHQNCIKVASMLNLNVKTVRLWVGRHAQTGGVMDAPRCGRPVALNNEVAAEAKGLLLSGKFAGAHDVAGELFRRGTTVGTKPVSKATLIRSAKVAALAAGEPIRFVRKRPTKQLSADTIKKRLAFCLANRGTVWKRVMFTDRKKFLFIYPGQVVHPGQWVKEGEQRTAPKVNHPDAVNVYAGITVFGTTKVHFVAGTKGMDAQFAEFKNKKGQPPRNITSLQYKRVVDEFCKQGSQIYSAQGCNSFVLQQDNDPTHKKASIQAIGEWNGAARQGCNVQLLANYPPNSPDLNPIENLWAYVQKKVDAAGCKTFQEFKNCVVKSIERAPKSLLKALIGSMDKRVKACIELKGGKTKY